MASFSALGNFVAETKQYLLTQLETAHREAPDAEPTVCRLLRLHCKGERRSFAHHFETADAIRTDTPVRYAELLFVLRDESGAALNSPGVLSTLETHRPDLHLNSHFRFWVMFDAAREFFATHPDYTHLSTNVAAHTMASPHFIRHFERGLRIFEEAHPGKGLIIEMLEHQAWGDNQRPGMRRLQDHPSIGWAVDDYGAPDGAHTADTLRLAAAYSTAVPPLVKIDGGLLKQSVRTNNFAVLRERLREVEAAVPGALVVLEWIDQAADFEKIARTMCRGGIALRPAYVQSFHVEEADRRKMLALNAACATSNARRGAIETLEPH